MKGASVKVYSAAKDALRYVGPHFQVHEFACKDGSDPVFISLKLIDTLEFVRNWAKAPVHVPSGYRTPMHNKSQGGSKYSYHQYGLAADIRVDGKTPAQVAAYLEAIMPREGCIGLYKTYVHVDMREKRYRYTKTSGREIPVDGF